MPDGCLIGGKIVRYRKTTRWSLVANVRIIMR